jgi:hypothetical protein
VALADAGLDEHRRHRTVGGGWENLSLQSSSQVAQKLGSAMGAYGASALGPLTTRRIPGTS